jgi:hypothetical protein
MHLRVRVDIHSLQGTVCAWVPPPPNDRLWFGFVSAPELRAEAAPLLSHNVRAASFPSSLYSSCGSCSARRLEDSLSPRHHAC